MVVNLKFNFGELMITCLCWMMRAFVISRLGCEDFASWMALQLLTMVRLCRCRRNGGSPWGPRSEVGVKNNKELPNFPSHVGTKTRYTENKTQIVKIPQVFLFHLFLHHSFHFFPKRIIANLSQNFCLSKEDIDPNCNLSYFCECFLLFFSDFT